MANFKKKTNSTQQLLNALDSYVRESVVNMFSGVIRERGSTAATINNKGATFAKRKYRKRRLQQQEI